METRASYLIAGAVVLVLISGLAAFSVWLVGTDVDGNVARYEISFEGSVSGLQEGGQVLYRGIPVGRAADIRINPEDIESVLVTIEVDEETPIKEDTLATLEFQGITGIAYVQLRGGTRDSARLDPDAEPPPRIPSRRSALERVFESTPQLLVRTLAVVERLGVLLDDDNLASVDRTLRNVEQVTATLADRSESIDALIVNAADAAGQVEQVTANFNELSDSLTQLIGTLDRRVGVVSDDVVGTLEELRGAAASTAEAADEMGEVLGGLDEPLDDFAATGLYEFTQLIGEARLLVAALNRITKEFERDPAGFLIGRSSRGFEPE